MGTMDERITDKLLSDAKHVLAVNDLGESTRPAPGLYPHQWFWDSCFIAVGLAHFDVPRAQQELRSLVKAQWKNGMIPHVIFSKNPEYHAGPDFWQSERNPNACPEPRTTAITQPPVLAEAVMRVASKLKGKERKEWLTEMYGPLMRYHEWIYSERDPYGEGLVFLIHSWESGLDNTPPWMDMIAGSKPLKVKMADAMYNLEAWLENRRKDTRQVPAEERIRTKELYTVYSIIERMRSMKYDISKVLESNVPLYVDLVFNSILIRANELLEAIATELGKPIPQKLHTSMGKTPGALRTLRSESGEFFGRDFRTHQFIRESAIGTFLPLYSGAITQEEADSLVKLMKNSYTYWLKYHPASAPKNSPYFTPRRYWQGPVWVNINWMLIQGLRRYGYQELAEELKQHTLGMVAQGGMYEYFSPLDGRGAGAHPFSWTASLTIDLLSE